MLDRRSVLHHRITVAALLATSCSDASGDTDGSTSSTASSGPDDTSIGDSSAGDTGGDAGELERVGADGPLGCPAGERCTVLLASETLDDRVEVFFPEGPGPVYRGAIDLDLKPNVCDGCSPGDNGDERLDEPYGLALAGGSLQVLVGHYPERVLGSLLGLPYGLLAAQPVGQVVARSSFFDGSEFTGGAIATPLGELEPIYALRTARRLLVGVLANDLLTPESEWIAPGKVLVVDPADPAAALGRVELAGLDGGDCAAAGDLVALGDDTFAIACDGDDASGNAIAFVELPGLDDDPPTAVAAAATGKVCRLLPSTTQRRVRHLAPDGHGGVLVAESASEASSAVAYLYRLAPDACSIGGDSLHPLESAIWQLGEIETLTLDPPVWLLAGRLQKRGIFVVHEGADGLEHCGPLPAFDAAWADDDDLHPYAIAAAPSGRAAAIGAGPFFAEATQVGHGRILWASFPASDDPCVLAPTVVDLTDGADGHAPAVAEDDPSTWRRAPFSLAVQEVQG